MKNKIVIVGLGNPEQRYANTRHNVGWLAISWLASRLNLKFKIQNLKLYGIQESENLILIKPLTGMNISGQGVKAALKKLGLFPNKNYDWLYVVHDDLDIKLGDYKLQFARGPKCHHGIESIEQELGTKKFWRLRFGVDNRQPDSRISGESYVLQNFTNEERKTIERVVEEAMSKIPNPNEPIKSQIPMTKFSLVH